jgi:hypothetical protein
MGRSVRIDSDMRSVAEKMRPFPCDSGGYSGASMRSQHLGFLPIGMIGRGQVRMETAVTLNPPPLTQGRGRLRYVRVQRRIRAPAHQTTLKPFS